MKPPPPHITANAFNVSINAGAPAEIKILAVPGIAFEGGHLTLAGRFSIEDAPAGAVAFRLKKVMNPTKVARGPDNEFSSGQILAGEPDPKDGKYRKAWILISGHGQPRLVRLSVIERDGTSELPLSLVVTRDYSTHFCAIRGEKGNLLAVLFATTKQTEAGESIEIRSVSEASLQGARYHLLREALGDLIDRSYPSVT